MGSWPTATAAPSPPRPAAVFQASKGESAVVLPCEQQHFLGSLGYGCMCSLMQAASWE